jgi:hypothetical protein
VKHDPGALDKDLVHDHVPGQERTHPNDGDDAGRREDRVIGRWTRDGDIVQLQLDAREDPKMQSPNVDSRAKFSLDALKGNTLHLVKIRDERQCKGKCYDEQHKKNETEHEVGKP